MGNNARFQFTLFSLPVPCHLYSIFLPVADESMPTETPGRRNINDNGGSTLPSWMESDKEEEEENGLRTW